VLGVMPEYSVRFANVGMPRMAIRSAPVVDANLLRPDELTRSRR
jgi:hypothetical protein